jgi:hypothetical protein
MVNTRFNRRGTPPRYLGRSQQLRLLMLVMSLGIILLAIEFAAKPESWYWLWGGRPPTSDTGDEIHSIEPTGPAAPGATAPLEWLVDNPLGEQLANVEDDQPFRAGEHDVFYELLARLAEAGPKAINSAAVATVSFVQLAAQAAEFRGKWVRFHGTVRRLKTIEASANRHGIGRIYQLWVQHDDDPRSVSVVYCTQLPDGFPGGATTDDTSTNNAPQEIRDLREPVTITGLPLKRWPYQAQDGMRTAPLVLTASPAWSPTSTAPAATRGPVLISPAMMGIALASLVAIALLIISRGSRRTPPTHRTGQDAPEAVVSGMKLADTSPNHVAAMRRRDEASGSY